MGDTSGFTAGDQDNSTAADTISTTTVEYKYAQMVVPSFEVVTAPDGTGETITWAKSSTSGNSFVRLGSFPVTATATPSTSNGTTTYSYGMTTDPHSDAPSGFSDSLTLAKLVGDVSTVASTEASDDSTRTNDDDVYTSNPFAGNKRVGFVDDTRIRDDAASSILHVKGANATGSLVANSTANRKAETRRLLTKGGWWDHSDGNRISTTAGDKVEVIQGNYKLLVLGRRAASDTGDAKVTDMSGGYDYSKTYEYLDSDDIWATYEESSPVHATKRTAGKDVSYFTGSLKYSEVGEDGNPQGLDYLGGKQSDPDVISKTWAQRIETYLGSITKPVPHIVYLTFAHLMEDTRFCTGEHVTLRSAGGSLTSANIAAINVTSMNVALTTITVLATLQAIDIRVGYAYNIHKTKAGLFFNRTTAAVAKQTVTVADDLLTSSKTGVMTNNTIVAANNTEVVDKSIDFASQSMSITNTRMMFNLEFYMM